MIVEFTVCNYGPFRDPTTLSMEASALKDNDDAVVCKDITKNGILTSVTIFGPNASGKSFLFKAVSALISVIGKRRTPNEMIAPYNPFKADKDSIGKPTTFRINMLIDRVRYDYSISYTNERVYSEELTSYPNNYPVELFKRKYSEKNQKLIEPDKLTDTTSYLLSASQYNDRECNKVLEEIMNIMVIGDLSMPIGVSLAILYKEPKLRPMLMDALDAADLGVTDIRLTKKKAQFNIADQEESEQEIIEAGITHRFEREDGSSFDMILPLKHESNGTREMLSVMVPITKCLNSGGTIFIDEFGSKLHHELTKWIMNLFNSDLNRNDAQIIVNTHDLGLMDIGEVQRRDQILFTNRNRETGASELYRLIDFRGITKKTKVLRDYLDGKYSAIPYTVRRDIL